MPFYSKSRAQLLTAGQPKGQRRELRRCVGPVWRSQQLPQYAI